MTLTDFLIIYLAFGAPIAVYKYFQNRKVDVSRRTALSIFTFFFWVPVVFELCHLYLANAYCGDAFVSHWNSDASDQRVRDLRESIAAELVRLERGTNLHDIRETVDRYTGLANEVRSSASDTKGRNELFEASGRQDYELGQLCLIRRNLRRLERHHIQARYDFVEMLDQVTRRFAALGVIETSMDLARQLEDCETVEQLSALRVKRGYLCGSGQQEQSQTVTPVPSIVMTASLKHD
ncbi:MAG: hypothetical protein ABI481_09670 [Pyrinomonadaceae bacterium]